MALQGPAELKPPRGSNNHKVMSVFIGGMMLAPSYEIGTSMSDPICATHQGLAEAYDFFNERLFAGRLPRCLVTMHRRRGAYGYFPGKWFSRRVGEEVTDEIALSPAHFRRQKTGESLLTLAREMCHHGQYHFGIPRANLMKTIGLIPTKTRVSGGNPGRGADHYIAPGGPFALACAELVKSGFVVRYAELWSNERARKTKYVCPACGLCAWGKPAIEILCGGCNERMEGEETISKAESAASPARVSGDAVPARSHAQKGG